MILDRRSLIAIFLGGALSWAPGGTRPAMAVEAGQPAPEFKLASTTGTDIALSDFRGKKWVLLEFYSADFAPT